MANEFKKSDAEMIWGELNCCAICYSNQGCALHHLNSRRMPHTSSMFNCIPLCTTCHLQADSMNTGSKQSRDYRQKLLKIIFRHVSASEYEPKQVDKDFLEYIKEDVQTVLAKTV